MRGYVAVAAAVVAMARALAAWETGEAQLAPDFGLYSADGWSAYPSPLGRAIGSLLGPGGLAVASAIAAGVCVLLVWRISDSAVAACLAAMLPVAWSTVFASVDSMATAMFLAAYVARGSRARTTWLIAASSTHLAIAPLAIVELVRRQKRWAIGAGVAGVAFAAVTPYGGLFDVDRLPGLLGYGVVAFVTVAVLNWPAYLPWLRVGLSSADARYGLVLLLVASAEAGIQGHRQARYALPAVLWAAAHAWCARAPSGATAPWGASSKPSAVSA